MSREMKLTNLDCIQQIPLNWKMMDIKYVSSLINGDRSDQYPSGSDIKDSGVNFITSENLHNLKLEIVENSKYITAEKYNSLRGAKLRINDLIFCLRGSLGICSINTDLTEGTIASSLVVIRPNDKINPYYLNYSINSNIIRKQIDYWMNGSCAANLSAKDTREFKICVPPISEQNQIVNYLNSKCEAIDQAIQKQKDIVNKLKEYKQSVITHTVTKGFAAKEKEKINSSLSDKWQYRKIKTVVLSLTDGTHGTFKRISKGEPLLSAKNVFEEGLNITDSESMISEEDYNKITANGFPHKGDVLLCCVGTVGRTTVYPYERPLAFQRSVIFMTPNTNIITSKMLNYALMSNDVYNQENRLINQAAQAGLYQGAVREIYIYVPPLEIQDEITDFLDSKCSKINESVERSNKIIQKLEEYKKSLIYNAVTGKIDCRNA